jgi:hypothetical protein
MKKVLFILMFAFIAIVSNAQTGRAYVFATAFGDTLTNTDTSARIIPATAGYSCLGIQVNVTKLSGSAITGKAYLYQSLDGSNYTLTDSANYNTSPIIVGNFASALVPSYQATAYITKQTSPGVYYLIAATSIGTVSEKVQFAYTAKQYFITRP